MTKDELLIVREALNSPAVLTPALKTTPMITAKAIALIDKELARPEPEPVAIGYMNAGHVHEMQRGRLPHGYVYPKGSVGADVAVYTSPPKREWQGLTGQERYDILSKSTNKNKAAARVEAKLKEKNDVS